MSRNTKLALVMAIALGGLGLTLGPREASAHRTVVRVGAPCRPWHHYHPRAVVVVAPARYAWQPGHWAWSPVTRSYAWVPGRYVRLR